MSDEELDRVSVIERRLTQREAAQILGVTSRQVRSLRRVCEQDGRGGLASKQRGRPSNRRLPAALRREVLAAHRGFSSPGAVARAAASSFRSTAPTTSGSRSGRAAAAC